MTNSSAETARRLFDAYTTYKEKTLTHRRFKHIDIVPLLDELRPQPLFEVSQVGESFENRAIYQVKTGTGPARVLLWSQMHGDEATATMALFDIFNFLRATGDGFDDLRQTILQNTTLYVVPMLNPDGAERFQRRTATDIDMNRDALRLQTPEGALLKKLQQELQPLVGFNLHDQNPRYSVGKTGRQAVMSFLATAYDEERTMNEVRKRSMQLIVGMNRVLQQFIPGQIGRFDDEFEPRAFGDNIQKWGTTLVLIESGGYKGDPEKMAIRQLNFVAILTALLAIANESYQQEDIATYQTIPENGRLLFDVLIRNATVMQNGKPVVLDIGINRYEVTTDAGPYEATPGFYYRSVIEDLGDLSTFNGLEEIDATGLTLVPLQVYPDTLESAVDLNQLDIDGLRRQGVAAFRVKQGDPDVAPKQPVHLLVTGKLPADPLSIGQLPSFQLLTNSQPAFVFINGFWEDRTINVNLLANGIAE
ncbi:hypothetical protein BN8_06063 [Fibrisoma limi BUZ 3]|uniref:Peptidase M14 domain-containing protein n=1 Tax=Fibrisoma limi BUZ 3 TaxID=1185876 RepID=I2GS04_9BACT|nr:M14 family zinc carboxypeptidase [Fibrisoma limi]CCH56682.1 hypothetical protein BN8_06063 [Fibrisoma limi BUZ 3]